MTYFFIVVEIGAKSTISKGWSCLNFVSDKVRDETTVILIDHKEAARLTLCNHPIPYSESMKRK